MVKISNHSKAKVQVQDQREEGERIHRFHLNQVVGVDGLLAGLGGGGLRTSGLARWGSIRWHLYDVSLRAEAWAMGLWAHEEASVARVALRGPSELDHWCLWLLGVAVAVLRPHGWLLLLVEGRPDFGLHQRAMVGALLLLLMGAELGRQPVDGAVGGLTALAGGRLGVVDLLHAAHRLPERAEGAACNIGDRGHHDHPCQE